ncbi:hypothetical protein HS088_TW12G00977 [Tripterygium wilfordii]|uniref:Uncharacterized protein n=1 Tax=Tripterygium wilfordii TaxID=458696 RepID=A0A7J7D093_TRIWF|nr:hypothetical protein HS088_TW12G00977 [Tripterygium wilfordii]
MAGRSLANRFSTRISDTGDKKSCSSINFFGLREEEENIRGGEECTSPSIRPEEKELSFMILIHTRKSLRITYLLVMITRIQVAITAIRHCTLIFCELPLLSWFNSERLMEERERD